MSSRPKEHVTLPIDDLEAAIRSRLQRENSAWAVKNVSITVQISKEVPFELEETLIIPVKDFEATMRSRLEGENSTSGEEVTQGELSEPEGSGIKSVDNLVAVVRETIKSKCTQIDKEIISIVPPFILENNSSLYQPRFISIGPVYRGKIIYQFMEDGKWSLLSLFTDESSEDLRDCIKYIKDREEMARGCYQRDVGLSSDQFVQILLVDSIFILSLLFSDTFGNAESKNLAEDEMTERDAEGEQSEWFAMGGQSERDAEGDPPEPVAEDEMSKIIVDENRTKLLLPNFFSDFLLVENQVPFFILFKVWNYSKEKIAAHYGVVEAPDLGKIFRRTQFWKNGLSPGITNVDQIHHLLDLYYGWNVLPTPARVWTRRSRGLLSWFKSWIPRQEMQIAQQHVIMTKPIILAPPPRNFLRLLHPRGEGRKFSVIPSASELYELGLKFKRKTKFLNMFDVSFENGFLEIPTLLLDSENMSYMANMLSYEITIGVSKGCYVVSGYLYLMDSLINTKEDIAVLQKFNVLNNKLVSDDAAIAFINSLGESVVITGVDASNNFYAAVIEDMMDYSASHLRRNWTSFRHMYCHSPWTGISVFTASFLLLFGCLQTYYTIFPRK